MSKEILIAENDEDLLLLLSTSLIKQGYSVNAISKATDLFSESYRRPHLFILDEEIRVGLTICKYLRQKEEFKRTPIVMISGGYKGKTKALRSAVDHFVKKPFYLKNLMEIIHPLMQQ